MSATLRSGRLAATRKDVVNFISSVQQDKRIARSVVLVNEAHVIALAKAGVASSAIAQKLLRALREIEQQPPFREGVEDVHVLIEDHVTKRIGPNVGGILNTGKSRNDQVVTAIRMTLREDLLKLSGLIISLEQKLLRLAAANEKSLFVGYTHQQPAQPITFAHYLLAVGGSFLRDNQRVLEAYDRVNSCPMGAGALAGTSFKLDRSLVARLLGFDGIVENSLDAVSGRDFVMDVLHVCSAVALDLSRVAQDLVFYSSGDVGLVELPDEFASTSSIMPQKKNPDVLEVVRARCAKVTGNYSAGAMLLHGLTTGYNLDYQELTPLVWDSLDVVDSCLEMMIQLIPKVKPRGPINDRKQVHFTIATELANVLVREEEVPFREAHHVLGGAVKTALETGKNLSDLSREDWEKALNKRISEKTFLRLQQTMDLATNVEGYKTLGSPSQVQVTRMISRRNREMENAAKRNSYLLARLQASSKLVSHYSV